MNGSNTLARNDQIQELGLELVKVGFRGEIRNDLTTRFIYSTDASIYQLMPLGVAFPKDQDDLQRAVEICSRLSVPVLARGAGSSLAGQAIGPAMILDCSRYLTSIREIRLSEPEHPENGGMARVEPGVILDNLNRAAKAYGLQFGPDPASSERATMGGSLANNATGAHSIRYGMAADHLLQAQVIHADGSLGSWGAQHLEELARRVERIDSGSSRFEQIAAVALSIRQQYARPIQQRWPRTWRRASGYSLNYLLPWSASSPPGWGETLYPPHLAGQINLAPLFAGSEGTLGVLREATVGLVPLPRHTILCVQVYSSVAAACAAVGELLERSPSAIELIPQTILRAARSLPAYAGLVDWVPGDPPALLVVEFSGNSPDELLAKAHALGEDILIAESATEQKKVWAVRKVGLGLLNARHGQPKPVAFIEDLAVPVERLSEFVQEIDTILVEYGTTAEIYAHASAGCLHVRPLLNLRSAQGVSDLRAIAQEAVRLTIRLGGSVSGEHGDGLARSEWLGELYGEELLTAMQLLKSAADPENILNPGKILPVVGQALPQMDENLRVAAGNPPVSWQPVFGYSRQVSLDAAIEQCNGAAVCRKETGVMCPSFQATQDEQHSTRGRANLLRALISGQFPTQAMAEKAVYEALDLCLACKGCKAECPSAVDMAKLRYEFLAYYYSSQSASKERRRLRDYLFAYIGEIARLSWPFAPLINSILSSSWFTAWAEHNLGIAHQHAMPVFHKPARRIKSQIKASVPEPLEKVFFLSDAFNEYFHPEVGLAGVHLLQAAGCEIVRLPVLGAGRTLISKGFLKAAQAHARRLVAAIAKLDPHGNIPIVGLEPSEIYTLLDEYPDLLPGDPIAESLVERSWMIDEFLLRPGKDGLARIRRVQPATQSPTQEREPVLLHGHCYQKARPPASDGFPVGVEASRKLLEDCGYLVYNIESGCCGMAGAFGYETEHYPVSQKIGEISLLPAIRKFVSETQGKIKICTSGVSCEAQITDSLDIPAYHLASLIWDAMDNHRV